MTKKDYVLIADTIKAEGLTWSSDAGLAKQAIKSLTIALAIKLGRENPAFDCNKFYKACGITN